MKMRAQRLTTLAARLVTCAALVSLVGCIFGRREERLAAHLGKLEAALGTSTHGEPRLLIYQVDGHAGRWTHEVLLDAGRYAERRTRSDGRSFAFGFDPQGAWLTVGDGAAVAADGGPWDALARTRSALYRAAFTSPSPEDEVAYMGRFRNRWELAFRPAGGKTLNLSIDRRHHTPKELDWIDAWTRLVECDHLDWRSSPDGAVLTTARCGAGSGGEKPTISSDTGHLASMQGMHTVPSWAAPTSRRKAAPLSKPAWFPLLEPQRPRLPARINGVDVGALVLDSGATYSVLSEKAAVAAGVMPTGEPPMFMKPPFLDASELWVGVIDTLAVGDAVLHGERVLVAKNPRMLHPEIGLLGESFFRHYVIDVDSPKRSLRVWDRHAFKPSKEQKRIRLIGFSPRIDGEIRDVASGHIFLDTGMPNTVLVHAPLMSTKNKRRRGTDAQLGAQDASGASPDYHTTVRGLRLGPIAFPRMDAIGRDRDRHKLGIGVAPPAVATTDGPVAFELGGLRIELAESSPARSAQRTANTGSGIAIAGMGLMRYLRLSFDLKSGFLFVSTGDAYDTLIKLGVDIEPAPGGAGAWVSRVLDGGPGAEAGLHEGDVVLAVDGKDVATADAALRLIAEHRGFFCHLTVEREGAKRHVMIDVARPMTAHQRW